MVTACCVSLFLPLAVVALTITAGGWWSRSYVLAVLVIAILPSVCCYVTWRICRRHRGWVSFVSSRQAIYLDRFDLQRIAWMLVLAAALSLFAELSMFRWQSCVFPTFALYKNFSLLACFAGLGLGYALAERRHIPLVMTPLSFTWQMVAQVGTCAILPD